MSANRTIAPALLSGAISLFVVLGLCVGPLYFSAALVCLAILAMRNDTRQGLLYAGLALVFLLVAFGYGIGKDLAQRDNLRDTQTVASTEQQ
ncbi:hypothetical protein JR064_20745 [Xanthomonas sp. CFBP 8703]|uniref:DUF4190 domain-containing protein n=1 Tax=Xanthomonas bonasiae TaxID=2810351 RepID=A0ABS3B7L7_9XANT|nr:hypothetical protein [Xanthomonas bonasiae]MBN6104600.1 hypothetical protein [Xanthomonas bonasiae]